MTMINFKSITKSLVITYCLGQLAACSKDYNFTPAPVPYVPPCDTCATVELSLKTDILPIFTSKCNSCHSSIKPILTAAAAYASLATYVNTGTPANSLLLTTFDSPGKMSSVTTTITAADKKKILDWITQGAKNN